MAGPSRKASNLETEATALPLIGWHERVALPDLGVEQLFAKIDTGADISTLHASDIVILGQGKDCRVEFTAPLLRRQATCTERSEEHTSELQSREKLVCRLLR